MICPSDLRPVCPESCPPIIHLVEWQRKLSHRSLPRLSSFFVCKMTVRFWMFWKQFAVLWGIYMVILNFNLVFFKNYQSNSHIFFLSIFGGMGQWYYSDGFCFNCGCPNRCKKCEGKFPRSIYWCSRLRLPQYSSCIWLTSWTRRHQNWMSGKRYRNKNK